MPNLIPWLMAALFSVAALAAVTVLAFVARAHRQLERNLHEREREVEEKSRLADAERQRAAQLLQEYTTLYESYQRAESQSESSHSELSAAVATRDQQAGELERLKKELSRRPVFRQQTYKIVSIGIPKTGKTSLILKWANPLWELKNVQGTSFDRYTRTVSSVLSPQSNVVVNHLFEIFDYGGEQIVDAHDTLVLNEIHGMLFVVDLGTDAAGRIEPERIERQLREFQPESLRFFFGSPRITKTCKTVVLFINKSDLIAGTPRQVEAIAREKFATLISNLGEFADRIEVEVMVGSAISGHNTHLLMPHFIRKLLPQDAFDDQLLQEQQQEDRLQMHAS